MRDYIEQLCTMPLFAGISDSEANAMMACLNGYTKTFQKGDSVFVHDDSVPCIGVVLSGSVQMTKEDIWGTRTLLAISRTGDLFGETLVCSSQTSFPVSFTTASNTRILFLPFERVMNSCTNACEFHHRLVENMMIMIARKNIQLMEKVDVTSKKTLREKIMTYLSQQSQHSGSRYIEIPLGRVELAEYLCADRSAMTRELSNMKKEGLIDYDRNTFQILAPDIHLS